MWHTPIWKCSLCGREYQQDIRPVSCQGCSGTYFTEVETKRKGKGSGGGGLGGFFASIAGAVICMTILLAFKLVKSLVTAFWKKIHNY